MEVQPGHDCGHEHTTGCYTGELICGLVEDAEQTATDRDTSHQHGQTCYALDCPHERGGHDDACGYKEAVAGTALGALILPSKLGASGYTVADDTEPVPEPVTITGVTWELVERNGSPTIYEEDREMPCTYYFQLVLPEGYVTKAALPEISVRYGVLGRAGADPNDTDNDGYHDRDVAAFQKILADHPSLMNIRDVKLDEPASWGLWDTDSPARIYALYLGGEGLTGTLDVSGFSKLQILECYGNAELTGLTLGQHDELRKLSCRETGISGTLDVSGCPKLEVLGCFGNAGLTGGFAERSGTGIRLNTT